MVRTAIAAGRRPVTHLGVVYAPGQVIPGAENWLRLESALRTRVVVEVLVEDATAA